MLTIYELTSAAKNATSSSSVVTNVNNSSHWDSIKSTFGADSGDTNVGAWIAKWAGVLGNSIKVDICTAAGFSAWAYKGQFDEAPGTSAYASARGGSADEVHVVVIDEDGLISGSVGTVLESYAFVSLASDAKNSDGSSNYVYDVINSASEYVWLAHFDGDLAEKVDAIASSMGPLNNLTTLKEITINIYLFYLENFNQNKKVIHNALGLKLIKETDDLIEVENIKTKDILRLGKIKK